MLPAGAGQGIGRAWAHALGEAGAAVAVVDVNLGKAQAVAGELGAKGVRALAVQADVSSKKDCQRWAGLGGFCMALDALWCFVVGQSYSVRLCRVEVPSLAFVCSFGSLEKEQGTGRQKATSIAVPAPA
jgi:hypothetical protein